VLHADRARLPAERSLGGEVDGVRGEPRKAGLDVAAGADGEADLGIGHQRDGSVAVVGGDDLDLDAEGAQLADQLLQGAHDAVDLRRPGVGHQQQSLCERGVGGVGHGGNLHVAGGFAKPLDGCARLSYLTDTLFN
jgi:hypothetical protein